MQKALLISILVATMVIPLVVAKGGSVKQAVQRSMIATAVFCLFYWIGLVWIYPNLASSSKGPGTTQQ